MRFLFRLVLFVVLIVGLFWLFRDPLMDRLARRTGAEVGEAGREARRAVDDLDLDVERIGAELRQTGRVVRRKAAVAARRLDEATQDARTTAKIKARLALDPDLSAREIGVDTTDGRVTLTGRVNSPEDVARAIRLAMQEDEVVEVYSTMQVRSERAGTDVRRDVRPAGEAPPDPSPVPTPTPLP